jgi:hypothetical protein
MSLILFALRLAIILASILYSSVANEQSSVNCINISAPFSLRYNTPKHSTADATNASDHDRPAVIHHPCARQGCEEGTGCDATNTSMNTCGDGACHHISYRLSTDRYVRSYLQLCH